MCVKHVQYNIIVFDVSHYNPLFIDIAIARCPALLASEYPRARSK